MSGPQVRVKTRADIRRQRRSRRHPCWDHLIAAPLWPACVHWTGRDACQWLRDQRSAGSRIIGVELADEAVRLGDLPAARQRTVAVPGHERTASRPRRWICSTWPWRSRWWAREPA